MTRNESLFDLREKLAHEIMKRENKNEKKSSFKRRNAG